MEAGFYESHKAPQMLGQHTMEESVVSMDAWSSCCFPTDKLPQIMID